jgi:hypothetical protein
MVQLNKKLERQQRLPPSQLVFIMLTIGILILISSLSVFHVIPSECATDFFHNDFATLLPLFISSPVPAVVSTSLASQHSYGVFNDIPDQRWELMRKQAHDQHRYVEKDIDQYLNNLNVRK